MFKFIGRALAGLVLTKDAQKAVGQIQNAPGGGKTKARDKGAVGGGASSRDQAIAAAQQGADGVVTADRAELIRQAMKVRSAKQTILASLDDETRAKLVAAAMKALLREGGDKE